MKWYTESERDKEVRLILKNKPVFYPASEKDEEKYIEKMLELDKRGQTNELP